jgi:hypothetical protein
MIDSVVHKNDAQWIKSDNIADEKARSTFFVNCGLFN